MAHPLSLSSVSLPAGMRRLFPYIPVTEEAPIRTFWVIKDRELALRMQNEFSELKIPAVNGVYDNSREKLLWEIPSTGLPPNYIREERFESWAQYKDEAPSTVRPAKRTAVILFHRGKKVGRYSFEELLRKPRDISNFEFSGHWMRTAFYLEEELHILTNDRQIDILGITLPMGGSERIVLNEKTGELVRREDSPFYTGAYLGAIGGIGLILYLVLRTLWRFLPNRKFY